MKSKSILWTFALVITAAIYLASCGQQSNHSQEHDHSEHNQDEDSDSGHDHSQHDHNTGDETMGETITWIPAGNATEAITKDFHFITGGIGDINPEIISNENGDVLKLNPEGGPASFVFHNTFGNVGVAVSLNVDGFEGDFKIVHHAKNENTYEFVSVSGSNMKLGRVVEGEETILDEGTFKQSGWFDLRVSAAGTHYKGYIGKNTTTHGHAKVMDNGYVGIMTNGKGEIYMKKIEVTPIEAE